MSTAATSMARDQIEISQAFRLVGRPEDALNALISPGDDFVEFYMLRGELQLELGRVHEAAGSFFTLVTDEPRNASAQYNLGICFYRLGRWTEASQAFEKALDIDSSRDDARLGLGDCLLRMERAESALNHFENCMSKAARPKGLFGKAVSLQLLGRFDEAEATYDGFLEFEPNSEEALSNLVAMNIQAGRHELARGHALRLLEISPDSTAAHKCLAAVALHQDEFETVVRHCGRIIERVPGCREAWQNLRFASGRVMSTLTPDSGRK